MMLALPFTYFYGAGNALFHDALLLGFAPGEADTQSLSVQALQKLRTVLEGHIACPRSLLSSLMLPVGPFYGVHLAAVLSPRFSDPAGYRYNVLEAINGMRDTVRRLLGNAGPPRPRVEKRPTTRPTRWYCHECGSGPYNIAVQTGCTNEIRGRQCDHSMCVHCLKE